MNHLKSAVARLCGRHRRPNTEWFAYFGSFGDDWFTDDCDECAARLNSEF